MAKQYTFAELCKELGKFPVGTRFKNKGGLLVEVEYLQSSWHSSIKALYWLESGKPVTITDDISEDTFELVADYREISWQEALQKIEDAYKAIPTKRTGVFIDEFEGMQEISVYDLFKEDLPFVDFIDIFKETFYVLNE